MATLHLIFIFYYHHQRMFNMFLHGPRALAKIKIKKDWLSVRVKETEGVREQRRNKEIFFWNKDIFLTHNCFLVCPCSR